MGVNGFYQNLESVLGPPGRYGKRITRYVYLRKPNKVKFQKLKRYDVLCVDVNNLIHSIARSSTTNEIFLKRFEELMIMILSNHHVTKSVYLALDGPGPRAKLLEQKKRRYERVERDKRRNDHENDGDFPQEETYEHYENVAAADADAEEEEGFDSNLGLDSVDAGNINGMAPVTEDRMDMNQVTPIATKTGHGRTPRKEKTKGIDSNQFTPGTLLMKELKEMLCKVSEHALQNIEGYEKTAFHISAADEPGEGEYKCIQHINDHLKAHRHTKNRLNTLIIGSDSDLILFGLQSSHMGRIDVYKMDNFSTGCIYSVNAIREKLVKRVSPWAIGEYENRIIDDFCFLSLLNGNDYVPGLKGYKFVMAWDAYINLRKCNEFEKSNLVSSGLEPFSSNDTEVHCTFNMNFLQRIFNKMKKTPNPPGPGITLPDRVAKSLDHYLRGIFWTMHYLRSQLCDPNYYYPYPSLSCIDMKRVEGEYKSISIPVMENPFTELLYPLEFCVALLPPGSRSLIPIEQVGKLLDPEFENDAKDLFHGDPKMLKNVWHREDTITRLRTAVAKQLNNHESNSHSSMKFQPEIILTRKQNGQEPWEQVKAVEKEQKQKAVRKKQQQKQQTTEEKKQQRRVGKERRRPASEEGERKKKQPKSEEKKGTWKRQAEGKEKEMKHTETGEKKEKKEKQQKRKNKRNRMETDEQESQRKKLKA